MSSADALDEGTTFPPLTATLASSRKRTLAMFQASQPHLAPEFGRERVAAKLLGDYRSAVVPRLQPLVNPLAPAPAQGLLTAGGAPLLLLTAGGEGGGGGGGGGAAPAAAAGAGGRGDTFFGSEAAAAPASAGAYGGGAAAVVGAVADALAQRAAPSGVAEGASQAEFRRVQDIAALAQSESRAVALRRAPPKVPQPAWHAPWKLHRVIAGHQGWVRALAMEPGNQWFASGAADRTIKIWDLASGTLKLTLTGHINTIRGIAVSPRHPYMFTCGEDKMVKCWDLETNKVIRAYDGHLSAVYALALHPTLDVLLTGGRDASCRVWDMRTRTQVHILTGHENAVSSILANAADPQVVTGSMDSTVRTWDLAAGKVRSVLTHHKKSVRALAGHAREFAFVSASVDAVKRWALPDCTFVHGYGSGSPGSILNTLALNDDGVLVGGGDDGTLQMWDYATGHAFQGTASKAQPGSLDAEAGIFTALFDVTGTRLITGEADKSIKIWREDPDATPETHPIDMGAWEAQCRAFRRY